MLRVVPRADQAVLFAVPQRDDDRPARRLRRGDERAHDLEHRRDRCRVVGRAVADVVAGPHVATAVTHVVVVRADHHVLVGEIGPRDDADEVGALIERLLVRIDAGGRRVRAFRQAGQRFEEVVLRERRPGRVVVATVGGVTGEVEHICSHAARERHREADDDRRGPTPSPQHPVPPSVGRRCDRRLVHPTFVQRAPVDATRARSEDRARSRGGLFSLVAACRPRWHRWSHAPGGVERALRSMLTTLSRANLRAGSERAEIRRRVDQWRRAVAGRSPSGAAGRLIRTVVPRPGAVSSTTSPACAATVAWTMASPRPVPPRLRTRDGSAR